MAKHEEKKFAAGVSKMTVEELGIELKNLHDKLYTLRSQAVTEKVENVAQFGVLKRNIARLRTEQSARRIKGVGAPRTPAAAPVKKAAKPTAKPAHKAPVKNATSAARPTRTAKAAGKSNKAAPKRKATKAKSAK